MIPILYEKNETEFENEGLGRLAETVSAVVTEERNGVYELELQFPVTGKLFKEIEVGRIIACTHDDGGDVQPFDIYKKSEPIGGIVTFYGHHISYRLNEIVVRPFTATTCATALAAMKTNSIGTNPFSISTDKDVTADYKNTTPHSFRAMLGGEENSILDVYGKGEYEFDKWNVILHTNRGIARSTQIRYGKNLVDYTNEMDAGDTYTAVVPYWYGEVSNGDRDPVPTLITLPESIITSGQAVPSGREVAVPLDLSTYFEEKPTVEQLRTMATTMLNNSDAWIPTQTITVDFVAMWQTDEYKEIAPLQSVKLCDTIGVVMSLYGTEFRTKVIKTVYNVIADRYDQIQLGDNPQTLASAITSTLGSQFTELSQKVQAAQAKADYAVSISGDDNQYFWFRGTGTDTGAHITQVERDQFEADPTMGGGNLLARSNGVAVRDGLLELASFGERGIFLNNRDNVPIMRVEAASNRTSTFCADGPFYNNDGTQTTGILSKAPVADSDIGVVMESAQQFTFVYGTASQQSTERVHGEYQIRITVEYDGDVTFTAYAQQRSTPEEEYGDPYPARIITCYYYAQTYQPLYTVGSSVGDRGGFSSTFGEGLKAESPYQFVVGQFNDNISDDIFEVGVGSSNDNRRTIFSVGRDGLYCGAGAEIAGHITSKRGSAASVSGHYRLDALYAIECRPGQNKTLTTSQAHIPTQVAYHDSGGNWLTLNSNGTITVNGACYVSAWVYLYITGATVGDAIYLYIEKNGVAQATYYQRHPFTNQTVSLPAKIIKCAAGDVLRVTCRNSTAGRGVVNASSFSCFGVRVESPL